MNELYRIVGGLQSSVENMTAQWAAQEKVAIEGRRLLHEKFETVREQVNRLVGRVDSVSTKVDKLEPSVATFDQLHQQGVGSKKTIALIWTAIVSVIGGTAIVVVEIIKAIWGKH